MDTIKEYLDYYSTIQPIEVVYRPNPKVGWGRNRKIYDGKCDLKYNHRTILDNEVVFDFDSDKKEENLENSWIVCERLSEDNIYFTVWDTGSKGIHIHCLFNGLTEYKDLSTIKRTILKYYAYGMNIDYQLSTKHLIRMEYGINDKVWANNKQPLSDTSIVWNNIPEIIIIEYKKELNKYLERRLLTPVDVDEQIIKDFLEGKFEVTDGREKFLFFLINMLKNKIPENDLGDRLISWYKYSGGSKLSEQEIRRKIRYHINSGITYSFGMNFFNKLLDDYNVVKKIN